MFSATGYQLYGDMTFEYDGTETYKDTKYFKYSFGNEVYILAPTRNITKVTFPFDDYYISEGEIVPLSYVGFDSLYGFTSVPENKVLMKPRTDIGTNAHGYSYVDLGLTSGTLWATCNVGATSETDYGSYFQWGDTVDKRDADCSSKSYKYRDGSGYSKYNTGLNNIGGTIDNKTTLDLEDDAARVNMEGDWRMPTAALIEELVEETNSEWVTGYNGTKINGRKFISKTDPSKYIFIPASGNRSDSSFNLQDSYGPVWGSSLNISEPDGACCLAVYSDRSNASYGNRPYGFAVRGVL